MNNISDCRAESFSRLTACSAQRIHPEFIRFAVNPPPIINNYGKQDRKRGILVSHPLPSDTRSGLYSGQAAG